MEKEISEKIEEAKKIAKDDYDNLMKKIGAHNPRYIRKWREVKLPDGRLAYALNGTPDKAFVFVEKDYTVKAVRQDGKVLKVFK